MRDITTIQEALVAAHIDALRSEASAVRARRERDDLRQHAAAGADVDDHSADRPPRRVRIGHWLMAFGEAVAGSTRFTAAGSVFIGLSIAGSIADAGSGSPFPADPPATSASALATAPDSGANFTGSGLA